jgi:hypothetical protein
MVCPSVSCNNEAIKQKQTQKQTHNRRNKKMDGKSFVFVIAFTVAGILALLGVYAMAFEEAAMTSPKVMMDFIFAGVLAFMAVLQYKVFESAERS